jgi:hypothetical protein
LELEFESSICSKSKTPTTPGEQQEPPKAKASPPTGSKKALKCKRQRSNEQALRTLVANAINGKLKTKVLSKQIIAVKTKSLFRQGRTRGRG